MKFLKIFALCTLLISSVVKAKIPLLGIDENGVEIEKLVSEAELTQWMGQAIISSSEILRESSQFKDRSIPGLRLRQVDIGFGFKAELGLGEIIKASASPSLTFKFKRK